MSDDFLALKKYALSSYITELFMPLDPQSHTKTFTLYNTILKVTLYLASMHYAYKLKK